MPPKRAAPAATASRSKKSKASPQDAPAAAESPAPPRDPRWAPVSGSANIDMEVRQFLQKPDVAYKYILMCSMPGCDDDSDEEDEHEDEEEGMEEDKDGKPRCDGGRTCLCGKPASEHPDHKWKITAAGRLMFFNLRSMGDLRDPDSFDMYTFNDHAGYGILEVFQNILLDMEQATGTYKHQWAICEALALFMSTDQARMLTTIDDSKTAEATCSIIARLFLSMLALLERNGLMSKNSEIQNLGLIMGLFLESLHDLKSCSILEESKSEPIGPKTDNKVWAPHNFPSHVLAYARKYDIELVGPSELDEVVEELDENVDLPNPASNTGNADPFNFIKGLKAYRAKCGGVCAFLSKRNAAGKSIIGGDSLDITTWTPKERAQYAFKKKDPLGKKELDAIKRGDILGFA